VTATVLQINVSRGGVPKLPVPEGDLQPLGLTGDGHAHPQFHGGPRQAVLVVAAEAIDELKARGFPVFPGALGENLTTRGLDHRQWRVGQRWRIGAEAVIELTKVRVPCKSILVYGAGIHAAVYDEKVKAGDPSSPKWCVGGIYAAVTTPGAIRAGDPVVACEPTSV
jgi:MOSC domain-containing protein YiiM